MPPNDSQDVRQSTPQPPLSDTEPTARISPPTSQTEDGQTYFQAVNTLDGTVQATPLSPLQDAAITQHSSPEAGKPTLPFSKWLPLFMGSLLGLLLRVFVFAAQPGSSFSAMAGSFIWLAPFAVGAVTVFVAEKEHRRSIAYYFYAPMLSTMIFVLGSLLILVEGLICAIVIIPLFSLAGIAGGITMGLICRLTNWPKPAAYSFAVLPLLAALVLPQNHEHQLGSVERSLLIQATPAQVWQQINNIKAISPREIKHAWTSRIGVPMPISGVTVNTPEGRVRKIVWDKGVHFDEVIQQWEPERHLRWTYRFAPDSFPAGALDDHVRIGGEYFDLHDTAYVLTAENGATRLHLRISYRLSTDFDIYANWVAQRLLGNFSEVILEMYKVRSEQLEMGRVTMDRHAEQKG